MKKILTLLMVFGLAMALVACSSGSDTEHKTSVSNMDGTYYEFYKLKKDSNWIISKQRVIEISDDTLMWTIEHKNQYSINKKEKTVTGNNETLAYSYNEKNEVLTIDGDTYVKEGSMKYKKLLDDGAEIVN
ncbi:hypothetical protein LGW17_09250 [Streptococcus mutans]|nr:hypothetical protein [Streptococcus mutans]MCB4997803.1 hypothetical protein [Streptococcus mutans]MCB5039497.1 hypothetical protein [Streptococcus mutans]MCB5065549.1 hypothetical protein [Streptococcus mutans]MCB5109923.1 hypothetical protein [Streptococcus mutans]